MHQLLKDTEQWVITEDLLPFVPCFQTFAARHVTNELLFVRVKEFRLLDELVVDARCKDSAWMPWQARTARRVLLLANQPCQSLTGHLQVSTTWEVSDGDRGFVQDIYVRRA